ncbi:MAG: efflux RND transporter periplasmic adaptor subunit, partial [Bacteroidota bacterium]
TQVTLGDAVRFTVAGAAETATGTVYAIEPRVERDTRTLLVRARVPNPDGALLPGAFADIEVLVDEIADALPVPAIAVVSELGGRRVWTVQDGQAQQRRVETGIRTENAVQITDGLAPGDTVITSGLQSLRAGQPVRVADLDASLGESGEVE